MNFRLVGDAKWAVKYLAQEYGMRRMTVKDVIEQMDQRVPRNEAEEVARMGIEGYNSEFSPSVRLARRQVMTDAQVARELVGAARMLVAGDMIDDFLKEVNSGKWNYQAIFPGRKRPTKNPKHTGTVSRLDEAQARKVIAEPLNFKRTNDMVTITFVGSAGRTDTYALTKVPYVELTGANPPKKQVWQIEEETQVKLLEMGLSKLGGRYGKAGEFYGVQGGARVVSVGRRDLLLNVFNVSIGRDDQIKRPDQRWGMKESILLSKVTDRVLTDAVKWVKAGQSMIEVREQARENYEHRTGEFGFATG